MGRHKISDVCWVKFVALDFVTGVLTPLAEQKSDDSSVASTQGEIACLGK